MASDKKYDISFEKSTETELDRQKAIMNKFMPVSYYEHHKLFLDTDVLRMMDQYRIALEKRQELSEIKWVELDSNPNEQNYPEVTC
jgi:hypothetical protein